MGLAQMTPLPDLLQAWRIAAELPVWAAGVCDRVEAALDTGEPSDEFMHWAALMSGPSRVYLVNALCGEGQSPGKTAFDALMLLFQREAIQRVLSEIPHAEVGNLDQAYALPPSAVAFIAGSPSD